MASNEVTSDFPTPPLPLPMAMVWRIELSLLSGKYWLSFFCPDAEGHEEAQLEQL
jgi:hypothetical protein